MVLHRPDTSLRYMQSGYSRRRVVAARLTSEGASSFPFENVYTIVSTVIAAITVDVFETGGIGSVACSHYFPLLPARLPIPPAARSKV
jgi:hypothetical protein